MYTKSQGCPLQFAEMFWGFQLSCSNTTDSSSRVVVVLFFRWRPTFLSQTAVDEWCWVFCLLADVLMMLLKTSWSCSVFQSVWPTLRGKLNQPYSIELHFWRENLSFPLPLLLSFKSWACQQEFQQHFDFWLKVSCLAVFFLYSFPLTRGQLQIELKICFFL